MKIVIIDCGFGNHGNIRAAINKIGINFSNKIQDLEKKDIILIPGVGNFKNSIEIFRKHQLDKVILDHHRSNGALLEFV